jgi:hypothetical protein
LSRAKALQQRTPVWSIGQPAKPCGARTVDRSRPKQRRRAFGLPLRHLYLSELRNIVLRCRITAEHKRRQVAPRLSATGTSFVSRMSVKNLRTTKPSQAF